MDPFAVLGVPVDLDLDPALLEARYLAASRACHPDHHAGADPDARIALLDRAAAVNNAYRVLRDRWRRAEAIVELRAPGALERHKQLPPDFLAEALDLAEEVAAARGGPDTAALRARVQAMVDADWNALRDAVAAGDFAAAATTLHKSRYHRKALQDLFA
ncbi:MAG TPA: Fe-S protein assembly co-chaperone HscB [Planctomycetota bacterium]|nr:Fe-S protein assembly co-chaperone HscB [Planctomycetota bacterium]